MQVIEQEQADDATGQVVRHRDRTCVDCTGTRNQRAFDSDATAATTRARNVGQPLAVRYADAVRLGTRVTNRVSVAHEP